ncbi:RDD family protein, partial [Vibrio genomosp. F10]|uniref:RDD family protein n=1 Tax=Vibrio genomosp. F10 TaxID=723171 RepID=UPI0003661BDB
AQLSKALALHNNSSQGGMMSEVIKHTPAGIMASRWSRFWAAFIDILIAIAFLVPVLFYTDFGDSIISTDIIYPSEAFALLIYSWSAYLLCHGYLLHKRGQTIGKYVFDIAVVDLQGNKLGLPKLFVKRSIPMAVLSYVPLIGGFIPLVNVLFIFRKDKRCLHDLIASTQVISVEVVKEIDFSTIE